MKTFRQSQYSIAQALAYEQLENRAMIRRKPMLMPMHKLKSNKKKASKQTNESIINSAGKHWHSNVELSIRKCKVALRER